MCDAGAVRGSWRDHASVRHAAGSEGASGAGAASGAGLQWQLCCLVFKALMLCAASGDDTSHGGHGLGFSSVVVRCGCAAAVLACWYCTTCCSHAFGYAFEACTVGNLDVVWPQVRLLALARTPFSEDDSMHFQLLSASYRAFTGVLLQLWCPCSHACGLTCCFSVLLSSVLWVSTVLVLAVT